MEKSSQNTKTKLLKCRIKNLIKRKDNKKIPKLTSRCISSDIQVSSKHNAHIQTDKINVIIIQSNNVNFKNYQSKAPGLSRIIRGIKEIIFESSLCVRKRQGKSTAPVFLFIQPSACGSSHI